MDGRVEGQIRGAQVTEPTAEDREASHEALSRIDCYCHCDEGEDQEFACSVLTTALARRAVEARDEALRKAEKLLRDRADVAQIITAENPGRERTALHRAADAIRALRSGE